jgi:hypothetical protein
MACRLPGKRRASATESRTHGVELIGSSLTLTTPYSLMNQGLDRLRASSALHPITTVRGPSQRIDNAPGCATFASTFPTPIRPMKRVALSMETPPTGLLPGHCRRITLTFSRASGEGTSHRSVFTQGLARCTRLPNASKAIPTKMMTATATNALARNAPTCSWTGASDPMSSGGGSANASAVSSSSVTETSERIRLASLARSAGTQMEHCPAELCGSETRRGIPASARRADMILAERRSPDSVTLTQSLGCMGSFEAI